MFVQDDVGVVEILRLAWEHEIQEGIVYLKRGTSQLDEKNYTIIKNFPWEEKMNVTA